MSIINIFKSVIMKNFLKVPKNLIFHVTFRCNSHCVTCFNWKKIAKQEKEKELKLDEIKKIALSLGKLDSLGISGGEPFLREDLPEICKIFYETNKINSLIIPTNGSMPEIVEKQIKKILKYCNCNVSLILSLDGTKEIHNKIRGIDCFDSVLKTYKLVEQIKDKRFSIRVASTVFEENYKDLLVLDEFIRKEMPSVRFHNFELMRGDQKEKLILPNIKELEWFKEQIFEIWEHYSFYKNKTESRLVLGIKKFLFDFYIKTLKEKRQIIPCYAGQVWGVLEAYGDVYFCELLGSIGNIKEYNYDFGKIWNNEKASKMREFIKNKKCYCTHSCFQISNVLNNPLLWPKVFSS